MSESRDLRQLRAFILDMDGVIYRGQAPLEGAAEFLSSLRRRDVPFQFVTNNSTTSADQVAQRLRGMGITAHPDEILTSAEGTATVLAEQLPKGTVLVVGEEGIRSALLQKGYQLTEDGAHADAVVVGLDRTCTYPRLREAALAVRRGAIFLATNNDVTLPTEAGLIPGAGALLAAVEAAAGTQARVIGKPSPLMLLQALRRLGTPAGCTGAVGDRPETDIVGGQRAGLRTIGLLTGVGTRESFAAMAEPPEWLFADLNELSSALIAGAQD